MKHMIPILSLILLIAGCKTVESGAPAAETSVMDSRVAAEKLLDVLNLAENFDSAIQQAIQMQSGMFDQMDLSEEEKAEAQKCMKKSMQTVLDKFSWAKMKDVFVDIYAEVFTAEELQGVIAFYESAEGRKFVEKQPQLMQVTMQKMQAVMSQMMPEIQKEVELAVEKAQDNRTDPGME